MFLSEADTKAKLIDPAIHKRGWTEDLISREETDYIASDPFKEKIKIICVDRETNLFKF